MTESTVMVVGGGLAGVCAAWHLEQQGVDEIVLLEGRERLGGRVEVTPLLPGSAPQAASQGLDLGPSWFWPGFQHELSALVTSLGLAPFAQYDAGDMLIERTASAAAARSSDVPGMPPSMRLAGGMGALVDTLVSRLQRTQVHTGQAVTDIATDGHQVKVTSRDVNGERLSWTASHVMLALPPRLAVERLRFSPALPDRLSRQWQATATWMAAHAKYVAVYETPFWRAAGLSGEARSLVGPMAEMHDASLPKGAAALFGFLGLPADSRRQLGHDRVSERCREQVTRLFGEQASTPLVEYLRDWALDPFTATAADISGNGQHPQAPPVRAASGVWSTRLTGVGSEWGQQYPGYLAGAVEAARRGVDDLVHSGLG